MQVSYVGLVKKTSSFLKVLVMSLEEIFYVWTAPLDRVEELRIGGGGEVPNIELELASEHHVDIGRGDHWCSEASKIIVQVEYHGVISGGQFNKRVLVKFNGVWHTVAVSLELAGVLRPGDIISVDQRDLSVARADHVSAGLGLGTLQRVKRVESAHV